MICSLKAIKQIEIFCMHRGYIDIRRKLEGGDGGRGVACKNVSAAVFNAFILSNFAESIMGERVVGGLRPQLFSL